MSLSGKMIAHEKEEVLTHSLIDTHHIFPLTDFPAESKTSTQYFPTNVKYDHISCSLLRQNIKDDFLWRYKYNFAIGPVYAC